MNTFIARLTPWPKTPGYNYLVAYGLPETEAGFWTTPGPGHVANAWLAQLRGDI